VPRCIDHVELIALAVAGGVIKRNALRLDGDPALALELHGVEHLGLHLPIGQTPAQLDEAVGEGRFAVVDVCNDGEITYVPHEVR
jgi:hypothetical protein